MSALIQATLWSAAATMAAVGIARVWRQTDAALWHRVWVTIAAVSLALPLVNALPAPALALGLGLGSSDAEMLRLAWSLTVAPVVIVVYLAGVAVCGVRLTAGLLLVGRLRRRSTPVEGLPLDWIREAAGETDAVVCTHTRVQVPIAVGWRHPIVILPESWLACDRARLAAVLRHELSHVTRRDFAWNVLGAVFHAVFWFSPAAWLVVRRIRLTSELAADRSAADALGRAPYARMLLDSARDLLHARSAGMLAPSAAAVLEARVAALTDADDDPPQATARTRRLAAALVAALLLSTAVVQIGTSATPPAPGDHDARHQIRHAQH